MASKGCSNTATPAVDVEKHPLTVGGMNRFYLLSAPAAAAASPPRPLVVDFHGLAEGAGIAAVMGQYGALAHQDGFVAAFPNGTDGFTTWDVNTDAGTNPDLAFIDALLSDIESTRCIDLARVYATGLSYGAILTTYLMCQRADAFAAFAPVAGIQKVGQPCPSTRRAPVITFHGTADPILFFNGGVGDLASIFAGSTTPTTVPPATLSGAGTPAHVAEWAKRNGCGTTPTDTKVTESVIHRVYDCPTNADVEFYIVQGGGHSWPGSAFSAVDRQDRRSDDDGHRRHEVELGVLPAVQPAEVPDRRGVSERSAQTRSRASLASSGIDSRGSRSSSTVGPTLSASGARASRSKPYSSADVAGQDAAHLVLGGVGEPLTEVLAGERRGPLLVGVVRAPHELVETDRVQRRGVVGPGLTDAHPAVALEVLGGRAGQDVLLGVAHLAHPARVTDLGQHPVVVVEHRGQPRPAHLGHDELEVGMPFEDPGQDHLGERAL